MMQERAYERLQSAKFYAMLKNYMREPKEMNKLQDFLNQDLDNVKSKQLIQSSIVVLADYTYNTLKEALAICLANENFKRAFDSANPGTMSKIDAIASGNENAKKLPSLETLINDNAKLLVMNDENPNAANQLVKQNIKDSQDENSKKDKQNLDPIKITTLAKNKIKNIPEGNKTEKELEAESILAKDSEAADKLADLLEISPQPLPAKEAVLETLSQLKAIDLANLELSAMINNPEIIDLYNNTKDIKKLGLTTEEMKKLLILAAKSQNNNAKNAVLNGSNIAK